MLYLNTKKRQNRERFLLLQYVGPPGDTLRFGLSSIETMVEYKKRGWTDYCHIEVAKARLLFLDGGKPLAIHKRGSFNGVSI